MSINGLESKILALADVEKKNSESSKTQGYFIGESEFVREISETDISLYMTDACKKKLSTALAAEPRATFDEANPNWVNLHFEDDVDVEFAFLYIRYSWKFIRADMA